MIFIPKLLRYCRGCIRLFEKPWDIVRIRLSLVLNNVQHEKITCHGIPYLAVIPSGKCIIGNNFTMNNGLRFNPIGYPQPCMIVVAKDAILTIGKNVGISQTSIVCHHSISIGDNVKMGGGVKVYDTDFHSLNPEVRRNYSLDMMSKKVAPVVIGNNVFIGAGSIILKGVNIGENSVVGAGSVVTKSIPANQIWGGNPARFIKEVSHE